MTKPHHCPTCGAFPVDVPAPPTDALVEACQAAIRYDDAIRSCANDPKKMASFCSAQGDDLDALYLDWITKARKALPKDGQTPQSGKKEDVS